MTHTSTIFAIATTATVLSVLNASPATAQNGAGEEPRTRNVAVIVHQGIELLDFAGPGEVFAAAANAGGAGATKWFNVYTVAPSAGEIVSQGFLTVKPEYTIHDCPKPDILVIPGGGTGTLLRDETFMQWAKQMIPETEVTLSVCTGAFVIAQAGLLDGMKATTHWSAIAGLKQQGNITVLEDTRFVDNGQIVTTAGVSAGIDGSLHVVARLLGYSAAEETARYMQYDWRPDPEDVKSYPKNNPMVDQIGILQQEAASHWSKADWAAAASAYRKVVEAEPDNALAWFRLGYALHSTQQLDEALKAHQRAGSFEGTGFRTIALYNVACVYALKNQKEEALAALATAAEAGFNNPGQLRNDSDLDSIRDEPRFNEILDGMGGDGSLQPS